MNKAKPTVEDVTPPSTRAGTRRQVMSKAAAVQGLTDTEADLQRAEARRRQLRADLTKAENRVDELLAKKNTYQGHLAEAIKREVS